MVRVFYEQDDIFSYAQRNCSAAVVWGSISLNEFRVYFSRFLDVFAAGRHDISGPRGQLVIGDSFNPALLPWQNDGFHTTCLSIEPPIGQLKILYFMRNSQNTNECDDETLTLQLRTAFDDVSATKAEKVAFNGVRPLGHGPDSEENRRRENERVALIREIINGWAREHKNTSIKEVHLVSRSNSFVRNAPQQ